MIKYLEVWTSAPSQSIVDLAYTEKEKDVTAEAGGCQTQKSTDKI